MNEIPKLKRGDLRDALVSYASNETREGRIDTMSLRGAARDLGVSSGAVYRHFDDKDALLIEIAHAGFMEMRKAYHAIRPEGAVARTPQEAIARAFRMGRFYMRFAHDNPTLWRMMFGRIGTICRERVMQDEEMRRYTALDAAKENAIDLYRLGVLPREPNLQDTRFVWSALHGAADLIQSGSRLDAENVIRVADETTERSLRSIGCPEHVIHLWSPDAG